MIGDLGRQPRAGARVLRGARGARRADRHVAGREHAEDRGDPRVRRARSTSRPTGPAEAFERLAELMEETGRALVHPFDDPFTIAGQGTVGLEILEDVPDADGDRRPGRRRRARLGHRVAAEGRAGRRGRAGALATRCTAGSRPASRSRSSPARSPTGSALPSRASTRSASARRSGSRACSSPRRSSPTGCASSTGARSSPASLPAAAGVAASSPEKWPLEPGDTVVCRCLGRQRRSPKSPLLS